MKLKEYIVVCQYGGRKFIRHECDTEREALDRMNMHLNADKKRKGRGARLTVRIFQQLRCYSN